MSCQRVLPGREPTALPPQAGTASKLAELLGPPQLPTMVWLFTERVTKGCGVPYRGEWPSHFHKLW